MKTLIDYLEKAFNLNIQDEDLYFEAFTHSSFMNEHKDHLKRDNERLEFLGDAVLELQVSEYLYQKFPDSPEGQLTRLRATIVREESLSELAIEAGFDQYVRLGKGEEKNKGRRRPALLADLFEAFLGALYLDIGYQAVDDFLKQTVFPKIDDGYYGDQTDYKTRLQEFLQKDGDISINYQLLQETGPAHQKYFEMAVLVEGDLIGTGSGRTKKRAEQAAAQNALQKLTESL